MRGVPRERSAIRRAPSGSMGTARMPAERVTMACSSVHVVVVEAADEAEAVAQRTGHQSGPGGGPDQGEAGQVEADAAGRRALADEDVQLEVLHGRIEDLLDRPVEPVDLVDEEDVALLEIGQEGGQITGPDQHGAGGDPEPDPHFGGHDPGQGGLAQARGPGEQEVVDRLLPFPGRLDDDAEVLGELALPHELVEGAGTEPGVLRLLGRPDVRIDGPDPTRGPSLRRPGGGVAGPRSRRHTVGQHFAPGLGRHRFRASWRRAVRTISSTGSSSSTTSITPRISSGPYPSSTRAARTSPRADPSEPPPVPSPPAWAGPAGP